jgi:hypothetical protein
MAAEIQIKNIWMPALAVFIVAVVVVMGIVTLEGVGKGVRDLQTVYNVTITMPATVTGTAAVGATGTYPYLQSATDCRNSTNLFNTTYYRVYEGTVDGGYIYLINYSSSMTGVINATSWQNVDVNCTIVYKKANTASRAVDTFNAGMVIFGTFMAIIVLALLGKMIIKLIKNK